MTRDELILQNMEWAANLARRIYYARRREHPTSRLGDVEDCVSIAHAELVHRADLYDARKNDNFQAYAAISVQGSVKTYFRGLLRSPNHDPYHVESIGDDLHRWDVLTVQPHKIEEGSLSSRRVQMALGALPLLLRVIAYRHLLCGEPLYQLRRQLRITKLALPALRRQALEQIKAALEPAGNT